MANIIVNDNLFINGKCTFTRTVNEDQTGFLIEGILLTHLYFDDIKTIDMKRYKLSGVQVYQEAFGSDDYNIGYKFTCERIDINGIEKEGAKFILYPSEMEMIENEMYKDEHPVLGDIGAEYKNMVKEADVSSEEGSEN